MNTQDTVNQSDNSSAALHTYDNSAPSTSLDTLAKALIHFSHFDKPTKETIDILGHLSEIGNIDAALFLARWTSKNQLSDAVQSSIRNNIASAIDDGYIPALLGYYESMIACAKQKEVSLVLKRLCEMGDDDCPDAFWILAQHFSKKGDRRAVLYGEYAEQLGHPPAIDALRLARLTRTIAVQEYDYTVKRLNKRIQTLTVNLEKQKAETHLEEAALTQQFSYWKQLAESAEARIASLTAESLRDEAIAQLKNTIKGLEDQVLDAQCGQEKAFDERAEAEGLADDLKRHNKFYKTLLRKNGIPFPESGSSSSTEEQP